MLAKRHLHSIGFPLAALTTSGVAKQDNVYAFVVLVRQQHQRLQEIVREIFIACFPNTSGRVHPRVPSGLCSLSFSSFFSIRQRELTPILTIKFIKMRFII